MYFLYLDESGTENTSHFVLAGIAIQAMTWSEKTSKISQIKKKFRLSGKELHAGWMMRRYVEQEKIDRFEELDDNQRIKAVIEQRKATLLHIATHGTTAKLKTVKTNFKKTFHYVHLTSMIQLADLIAYATRRFFENGETDLFDRFYPRFDRLPRGGPVVGIRHFTGSFECHCKVCMDHNQRL